MQSISSSMRMDALIKGFQTYKLDVMAIQEIDLKGTFQETFPKGVFFYSIGKPTTVSGMGFLSSHGGTLKVVNDRIIPLEIVQKNQKNKFIKCYVPLWSAIRRTVKQGKVSMIPSKTLCRKKPKSQVKICIGDFNSKTGLANETHPYIVGCYGKGLTIQRETT